MIREALYYDKSRDNKIKCYLCPFQCRIKEGEVAMCMGRKNIGGVLYAVNYGKTTSMAVDPIEKKPLFHFYPANKILSISANSCNLKCSFCQNFSISQEQSSTRDITPEQILDCATISNSIGVAYTYSEPLMWYEFVLDTAKLTQKAGLKNVLVTNGTINQKPLRQLIPYIDAVNVDLKSINDKFYRKVCKGLLKPVLDSIILINDSNIMLEITNLIIPTLNDSDEDISGLIDWIADLNPKIPLHFSAYHPCYMLDLPPTPYYILKEAYEKASEKLEYVYLGNVSTRGTTDSYCPGCKKTIIKRDGYTTKVVGLDKDRCLFCKEKINIRL